MTETPIELYFSPLSCSMATRIALTEARAEARYVEVDPLTKRTSDGRDFTELNPLGLVPTLRTAEGGLLTENVAVLLHVAERYDPRSTEDPRDRDALLRWLGFIATELHKGLFSWMFDPAAPEAVRAYAATKGASRLRVLDAALTDREHLLDRFTVADAYLLTVLHWAQATPVDLSPYPAVAAYLRRGLERPSVRQTIEIERPLYIEERRRARARAS